MQEGAAWQTVPTEGERRPSQSIKQADRELASVIKGGGALFTIEQIE
jgi:hypothetical protein